MQISQKLLKQLKKDTKNCISMEKKFSFVSDNVRKNMISI